MIISSLKARKRKDMLWSHFEAGGSMCFKAIQGARTPPILLQNNAVFLVHQKPTDSNIEISASTGTHSSFRVIFCLGSCAGVINLSVLPPANPVTTPEERRPSSSLALGKTDAVGPFGAL